MQILNAPTRADLDKAHARSSWVNVGVTSFRNLLQLGPLRFVCWFLLACSSIPLHLFFNSLVFEITETPSDFCYTIATESFLHGADYSTPGSSLWNTMVTYNCSMRLLSDYKEHGYLCENSTTVLMSDGRVTPAMWMNDTSEVRESIDRAATSLSNSTWERIDVATCRSKFIYCDGGLGLMDYRNVVVVVSDPDDTGGWRRDRVFPDMNDEDTDFWDDLVQANLTSSLWHHESCSVQSSFEDGKCTNTCKVNMGFSRLWYDETTTVDPNDDYGDDTWDLTFYEAAAVERGLLKAQMRSGFDQQYSSLHVEYCVAEKAAQQCKVGLSNVLLFAVMTCVAAKTAECIFILVWFVLKKDHPLVTLGDAIDSLLRRPDPTTLRMCTLQASDVQTGIKRLDPVRRGHGRNSVIGVGAMHAESAHHLLSPNARQWKNTQARYFAALPRATWLRVYVVFVIVISVALYYFSLATGGSFKTTGIFGISGINNFVTQTKGSSNGFTGDFLKLVLLANVPQLVLSISYILLNNILTKLCMAREWAHLGVDYKPLRVTEPKGDQTSTYRLQMPYSWGIPCVLSGILVHWLASNSCYVFMADGGFYGTTNGNPSMEENKMGLSVYGFVAMGYSSTAIATTIGVFVVIVSVPLALSAIKMSSNMAIVGSNSLTIAAACHGSTASKVTVCGFEERVPMSRYTRLSQGSGSEDNLAASANIEMEEMGAAKPVLDCLAETRVKWGVVEMHADFYKDLANDDVEASEIKHLSFGAEADNVSSPVSKEWYA